MTGPAHGTCSATLVIGLGLIGGSLAAGLRKAEFCPRILGWDKDADSRARAVELGHVDAVEETLETSLRQADLVVVAVPTLAVESVFATIAGVECNAVLTDVASVKGSVLGAAERVFGTVPQCFVPGHPIAGKERSGVNSAEPDLFRAHRVILTPRDDTCAEALGLVESMWECCGAELVHMSAAHHDRVLAFTSHLPHVLAYGLVNALASEDGSEEIFRFAAGGFRDFTRIASSDPVMWRDIVLANRESVLVAMDRYAASLAELRALIDASQGEPIEQQFADARAARNRYLGWLDARHDD